VVLCVQLPASVLVVLTPGRSLTHVWLTVALSYVALALAFVASYRRGKFLQAVVA